MPYYEQNHNFLLSTRNSTFPSSEPSNATGFLRFKSLEYGRSILKCLICSLIFEEEMREKRLCKQLNWSAWCESPTASTSSCSRLFALFTSKAILCGYWAHNSNFQVQCNAVYRPGAINPPPPLIEKCDWHIFIVRRSITWQVLTRAQIWVCEIHWVNAENIPFLVFQNRSL